MNRVAFVTGGGTGIGRGIALELAKAGYDVAVHCHSSTGGADSVADEIRAMGRKCAVLTADLSKVSQIKALFAQFDREFDRLDLFVNNAGVTLKSPFLETTEETFDRICGVDYKGAYFAMQAAARRMVAKQIRGSIVVISSNNDRAHFADVSVYGSTKAALAKLAGHIAIELAQYGIRVNTVAPGWTDTGSARLDDPGSTYYKVPLQRWTTPAEIGQAVLYLSGDYAKSITGTELTVDGGALLVCDKRERYGF